RDGRPVHALAQRFIHAPIQHVATLSYLRFISGLGIAGIAVFFFQQIRVLGGTRVEHFAFAIALSALPCLHAYVAQAVLWLGPFAGLAVLAATALTYTASSEAGRSFLKSSGIYLAAFLLMIVASATYQPMLSMYWTVVIIYLLDA